MKSFQKFQQVTGGAQRGPGGAAGGGSNPYANNRSGGGGNNRGHNTRNRPKNRNTAGGGGQSAPPPDPNAPTITEQSTPGAISTLATEKPLDYFSGLLSGQGQLNAGGPSVYQNWQQNQAFNNIYSQHMAQFEADPLNAPAFDQYLVNTYGPGSAGLTPALQRQFNLATPTQRGDFNNVFNNSTGRTQFWG